MPGQREWDQTPDSLLSLSISAQSGPTSLPDGNEDVPSNGKHNGCGQMEDISL